jgi:Rrf2 family protein
LARKRWLFGAVFPIGRARPTNRLTRTIIGLILDVNIQMSGIRPIAAADAVIRKRGSKKMFSQTVEYALRIVVWLASQNGEPRTTRQIAGATRIPAGYLSKVLQNLGRSGIVIGQRGVGGGFTLSVPPERLSPLDIINAVDPIKRIKRCPLGLKAHSAGLCPLHRRLDEAIAVIEKGLGETRISDLVAGQSSGPFCEGRPIRARAAKRGRRPSSANR